LFLYVSILLSICSMNLARCICVALLVGILATGTVAPATAQDSGAEVAGKVVRVLDGDTFEVRRPDGQTLTVRLFGVDAPESDQPFGAEATQAAQRYVGGARVRLTVRETGAYGRTIGRLHIQGRSLAQLLVRDGLAWHSDRYAPNETTLARLERRARNANRGLWSQRGPVPPWDWRDGLRSSAPAASDSPSDLPYDPDGPDRDCSAFSSQAQAQRFYEAAGPGDPHRLDGDDDGRACEAL
jgi:endonuclease YncB( thermonuclease family)